MMWVYLNNALAPFLFTISIIQLKHIEHGSTVFKEVEDNNTIITVDIY